MQMTKEPLDRIIGLALTAIVGCLVLYSFWDMGRNVRDALVLTSYVTHIAPNEERSFGYGGEGAEEKVDVPFQGRDMSNVSFLIGRNQAGQLYIKGRDDLIIARRQRYEPGTAAPLADGDVFEARGPLGRAAFNVLYEEGTGALRLRLRAPIFRDLRSGSTSAASTRLVVGPRQNAVPFPVDEVFFRTSGQAAQKSYRVWVDDGGLRLKEDEDLASAEGGARPAGSQAAAQAELLAPGGTRAEDTVEYSFRHYTAPLVGSVGLRRVTAFGLRFVLAVLLVGVALSVADRAPRGPTAGPSSGAPCSSPASG